MSKYLLMWLEGPMMSWGNDSKFNRRDTLDFPTKSAMLGLICCARGAGGEECEWLSRWASTDMRVLAYAPEHHGELKTQSRLTDFHMVGSNYNETDAWEKMMMPKTITGTKPVGGGAKLSYRYYLQDVKFAVILECSDEVITEAYEALLNPVWDLYLGRKCCAPTDLIARGVFNSIDDAVAKANDIATSKSHGQAFVVHQGRHEGEVISLNDVPVQFGPHKVYSQRLVTVIR